MKRTVLVAIVLSCALAYPAVAQTAAPSDTISTASQVQQSPMVLSRFKDVQAYRLDDVKTASDRETINPDQAIKATVMRRAVSFDAGALFVPMAQAGAGIVAATLESDTPGSYLSTGIIPLASGATEAPIFALERMLPLPLVPVDPIDSAQCRS